MTAQGTVTPGSAPTDPPEDRGDQTGPGPVEDAPPPRRFGGRVVTRETVLMLVIPPAVIALVFGGFVLWRLTADLDSVEASALRWSEIASLTWEHIVLSFVSALIVVVIAVPLGIVLTRGKAKAAAPIVVGVANAGQAAPSVGLIVLLFLLLGGGFWTAVIALSLYGLLPVLRNTIVGIQGVDPTLVEAGKGIGMTSAGTLLRIELPLAVPVIMSGVRTALVLLVGTASLATFINAGGLGDILNAGITLFRFSVMVSGALLIALLALLIEWLGRVLELATRPKGI